MWIMGFEPIYSLRLLAFCSTPIYVFIRIVKVVIRLLRREFYHGGTMKSSYQRTLLNHYLDITYMS